MINAGELNKKLRIMKVIKSKNDFGEEIKTYSLFVETFANVKQTSKSGDNKEIYIDNKLYNRNQKKFVIRYLLNLTDEMVLLYRGKYYTIENINNVNEANVEIEIIGQLLED